MIERQKLSALAAKIFRGSGVKVRVVKSDTGIQPDVRWESAANDADRLVIEFLNLPEATHEAELRWAQADGAHGMVEHWRKVHELLRKDWLDSPQRYMRRVNPGFWGWLERWARRKSRLEVIPGWERITVNGKTEVRRTAK